MPRNNEAARLLDQRRLIPNITSTASPVLLRARLVHNMVKEINRNTMRVQGPRLKSGQFDRSPEQTAQVAASTADENVGTQVEGQTAEETDADSTNNLFTENEVWNEVRRNTSTQRVENPDDSSQYVDFLRIDSILFIKSDGQTATLVLDNP